MKTKMRWMAGVIVLAIAAAACRESLVQPDAGPSLNQNGPEIPDGTDIPDDTVNTGYFGSGHYEPANPPPDTTTT